MPEPGGEPPKKSSLPERDKFEYQRLAELALYFLDYRLKMFGIFVALNGVGLTAVLAQKTSATALAIATLVLVMSIFSYLLAERAIRSLTDIAPRH